MNSFAQKEGFEEKTELQIAIEASNLPKVKELISKGANVNEANRSGITPIYTAIEQDQLEILKFLISKRAKSRRGMQKAVQNGNIEMTEYLIQMKFEFENSLVYAAENNNLRMVRLLVESGSDVNITEKRKSGIFSKVYLTPIQFAAKNGNKEMVHFLVDYGVHIAEAAHECFYLSQIEILKSLIDRSNSPELFMELAFINENRPIVNYLLEKGNDLTIRGENGNSMLHISCEKGNIELAKLCVDEHGLDVNNTNEKGQTPLMMAIQSDDEPLVRYLVQKGADVNAIDNEGRTPVFYSASNNLLLFSYLVEQNADLSHKTKDNTNLLINAAKNKDFKIIKFLLDNDVIIDEHDDHGFTAFQYFISPHDRNTALVDQFVAQGANIDERSAREGKTLMYYAIEREDLKRIKSLKELGANINIKSKDGHRPRTDDKEIIRYLIENGADINATDRRDDTYLCIAIYANDLELAHFLISNDIDVNQSCYFGEPPLVKAIEDENITLIQFMVDNGADVNATGPYEKNIMEYAERQGNKEIIAYIEAQGGMTKKDKNDLYKRSIEMESKLKTAVATKNEAKLADLLQEVDGLIIQDRLIKRMALFAAEEGNPIVMELVVSELDYDLENILLGQQQTVLTIATINDKTSTVSYLIGKGANVDHLDSNGKYPSDYAASKAMKSIYESLEGK